MFTKRLQTCRVLDSITHAVSSCRDAQVMDHAVSAKIQEIDSQLDAEIQTSGADPDSMTAFELCISSFIAKWFEPCFVHKLKVVKGGFGIAAGKLNLKTVPTLYQVP